jgi:hypothetical protein
MTPGWHKYSRFPGLPARQTWVLTAATISCARTAVGKPDLAVFLPLVAAVYSN